MESLNKSILISAWVVLLLLSGFSGGAQEDPIRKTMKVGAYTGYIFPGQSGHTVPGIFDAPGWTPSPEEVDRAEQRIAEFLAVNSEIREALKRPAAYKRQYVGYIDEQGNKVLWVNFICSSQFKKEHRNYVFFVLDGGNCYWNLKVKLETGQVFDVIINGNA